MSEEGEAKTAELESLLKKQLLTIYIKTSFREWIHLIKVSVLVMVFGVVPPWLVYVVAAGRPWVEFATGVGILTIALLWACTVTLVIHKALVLYE